MCTSKRSIKPNSPHQITVQVPLYFGVQLTVHCSLFNLWSKVAESEERGKPWREGCKLTEEGMGVAQLRGHQKFSQGVPGDHPSPCESHNSPDQQIFFSVLPTKKRDLG